MTTGRIEVVDCQATTTVTASGPLHHLCPFRDEVDRGTVQVEWSTSGNKTIELHSLTSYLEGFETVVISHEGLVEEIRTFIEEHGFIGVRVSYFVDTADLHVRVVAG